MSKHPVVAQEGGMHALEPAGGAASDDSGGGALPRMPQASSEAPGASQRLVPRYSPTTPGERLHADALALLDLVILALAGQGWAFEQANEARRLVARIGVSSARAAASPEERAPDA